MRVKLAQVFTPDALPGTSLPGVCVSSWFWSSWSRSMKTVSFSCKYDSPNILHFRAITFLNHTVPDFTDNGASNFIKYGNDYYAASETNYINKIDPETLETQEKVKLSVILQISQLQTRKDLLTWHISKMSHAGGLLEVPACKLSFMPPALWQGGQCLQHWNFNSSKGQN